jgi:phosphohistidine swiveling domain-containing protein
MSNAPQHASDTILEFGEIKGDLLAVVGGKAGNLGELTRAGLPVPPGFCLTTEAYRQATENAGLEEIFDALERAESSDVATLSALAERARDAVRAVPIPPAIAEAVAAEYAGLGADVPVAVRSSATAEDLPFASFAGQQDTYLNIVGRDDVLDAVRRCWASLWTERAVVYRATQGIDNRTVRLAVVVQQMVDATVAGVLFTANPVTGRRREAVIDASPGLGEAVVSGAVNPDHFVIDTSREFILDRRLGDKRLAIRSVPGGGTEHVELDAGSDEACVTDDQLIALARLGHRVEEHFGSPQDTEWAIDADGTLWLTQARPITTLYPLPVNPPRTSRAGGAPTPGAPDPAGPLRVYFSVNVAQGVFRPFTPAGIATFRLVGSGAARLFGFPVADPLAGPPPFAESGGRVFIDVTTVVRSRVGRGIMPKVLDVMEARSAVVLRALFDDPRLSITQPSRVPFLRHVGGVALRFHVPLRLVHALLRPAAARARVVERLGSELDVRLAAPTDLTAQRRLDWIESVLLEEVALVAPRVLPVAVAGFVALWLARRVLGPDAHPGELQTVLRGLPHNVTTEMDLDLWNIATRLRADEDCVQAFRGSDVEALAQQFTAGTLPEAAERELRTFLRRYGHRAVAEIDLGIPRWSDDPRHLLGVLANYLRMSPAERAKASPDQLFAAGAAEAEAMIDTLAGRVGPLRGRVVRALLDCTRQLAGVRELPKYYFVRIFAAARAELGRVGEELHRLGRIAEPDDVYFLDFTQARAGLNGTDLHDVVALARETYDAELRRRHVPRLMLSDGTEPEATTTEVAAGSATAGALTGTPASAGTVTGTARVILDPVGAQLEHGEILVCPSTDPGWTPLFLTAGGLVMEMGGANSHGAVVAREYGIPAVVGVADAVATIQTGSTITVNGTAGTVTTG